MIMNRNILKLLTLYFVLFSFNIAKAQHYRPYEAYTASAFVEYNDLHPKEIATADNNWDILMAFRQWHKPNYLDSLNVPYTQSQLMLLTINKMLKADRDGYISTIPLFDSLATARMRKDSRIFVEQNIDHIAPYCTQLRQLMAKDKCEANTYSILFSYILDTITWELLNTNRDSMTIAPTWKGAFYLHYYPRQNACGTNTYGSMQMAISHNYRIKGFDYIDGLPFEEIAAEYQRNGCIKDEKLKKQIMPYGVCDKNGKIQIPVIHFQKESQLNLIALNIAQAIKKDFTQTAYVQNFMKQYHIDKRQLAIVILYHEYMWDLLDILCERKLIQQPKLWTSKTHDIADLRYQLFLLKVKE